MFASIIRIVIGSKFQIDPITVTLVSGSGPKSPPLLAKSKNAVGYGVNAFYSLKYHNLQKTKFPYKETKKTNKLPHVAIQRLKALNVSRFHPIF